MSKSKFLARANTVGTIHLPGAFAAASDLSDSLDFVEVRGDLLSMPRMLREVPKLATPYILTVRHPKEGGGGNLSVWERRQRFLAFLSDATFLDLELRSLRELRDVWCAANDHGIKRIVSWHDFKKTPDSLVLQGHVKRAADAGADIVKIATFLRKPSDLARLLELFDQTDKPLALMGMGPLGRVSRLTLAASGSVLNYGWLYKPQVPGQWPAQEFARMLALATNGPHDKRKKK